MSTWFEIVFGALHMPLYHVIFEVLLILGIMWLFTKRSYKPLDKIELSEAEKEELINEWQPEPLVPPDFELPPNLQKVYDRLAVSPIGKYVTFENYKSPCLNVASFNFLNFVEDPEVMDTAVECLHNYGVGSCGPRGFYGTMDVHLKLEENLAKFMNCEEAVVYSYGFSTVASAIPAYAKRTDVIFADEGICFAIQKGIVASRSRVRFFRHNDLDHLEELLQEQEKIDKKDPKKAKVTRRFAIVEGLYINYGDFCPLKRLVELKYKYKVRIFMDESYSFGVIGATGRGVTEYFDVGIEHIDMITSSLETALGSCGGFSVGTKYVMDHQRLSSQGYCFSASLPPLLASAADRALEKIQTDPNTVERMSHLNEISRHFHDYFECPNSGLEDSSGSLSETPGSISDDMDGNRDHTLNGMCNGDIKGGDKIQQQQQPRLPKLYRHWTVQGEPDSPIKHLRFIAGNTLSRLEEACDLMLKNHDILLTVARYLHNEEYKLPAPSIRLAFNGAFTTKEFNSLVTSLEEVGAYMMDTWDLSNKHCDEIGNNSNRMADESDEECESTDESNTDEEDDESAHLVTRQCD